MVVKPTPSAAAAVAGAFVEIAHRIVWATVATVDRRGRPRSRVLHPFWEAGTAGITGWVFTRPTPLKVAHLAAAPHVSCSYWDRAGYEVAVAECDAALVGDAAVRRRVWDLFAAAPAPLGYDPRILGVDDPLDERITVLRMDPWRLSTSGALPGTPRRTWRRPT